MLRSVPSSHPAPARAAVTDPEDEQAALGDPPSRPPLAEPAQPEDPEDDADPERDHDDRQVCGSRPTVTASDGPSTPSTLATEVAVASRMIGRLIVGLVADDREALAELADDVADVRRPSASACSIGGALGSPMQAMLAAT